MQQRIFYSNRAEHLFSRLKELFCQPSATPFPRRLLVVPNSAVRAWLMVQFAKDIGIAAGWEIMFLKQAFSELKTIFSTKSDQKLPSSVEITLALELEIKKIFGGYDDLPIEEKKVWDPLFVYLKAKPGTPFSKKNQRRLLALTKKLSFLFDKYGNFAGKMAEEWDRKPLLGWQEELWRRLFNTQYNWTYPYRDFQKPISDPKSEIQIYFFGISFLSNAQYQFLAKISEKNPVHLFILSPCRAFWLDIKSDREIHHLKKKITKAHQEALEEFLRERNPLLANFGRLGREMATQIEDCHSEIFEDYEIATSEEYAPLLDGDIQETQEPMDLLKAVQADLLLLQPKLSYSGDDNSIQLHITPTRFREVEILYQTLLGISSGDIVVMAPDITLYEPYIKAVFGHAESQIDFQLMETTESSLVQAFFFLLNLRNSRWESSALLQLFDFEEFRAFSKEDVQIIRQWVKDLGIHWGENKEHRNELLKNAHCTLEMVEETDVGTWDHAFDRLVLGLAMIAEDGTPHLHAHPYERIDNTQSELLGKCMHIVSFLRKDLKILSDGTQLSLNDWIAYLQTLCQTYFSSTLDFLKKVDPQIAEAKFCFESLFVHLESLLKQEGHHRENQLNAVRFCSMRAIPAKVICLLGMEEGVYPKIVEHETFNLMTSTYCPTQTDQDRYLFLEILLSARDYLILSYTESPSLLVTELLSYLNDKVKIFHHPFFAFDAQYFSENSPLKSYSHRDFRAAQAYYRQEKAPADYFVTDLISQKEAKTPDVQFVDLKHLAETARNPLKTYFKGMGIYLSSEQEHKESFSLSALESSNLRKAGLSRSIEQLLKKAEKQGKLPTGMFKTMARTQLSQEVQEFLKELNIDPKSIVNVEFSASCTAPYQKEDNLWLVPPIAIDEKVKLVGRLDNVSSQGLIVHGKGDLPDFVKSWPHYLAMLSLEKFAPQILFLKDQKTKSCAITDSKMWLKRYLDYYLQCQKNASLLLPDWIPSIIKQENLKEVDFNEQFTWILNHSEFSIEPDWQKWNEQVNHLFGETLHQFSKGKKS